MFIHEVVVILNALTILFLLASYADARGDARSARNGEASTLEENLVLSRLNTRLIERLRKANRSHESRQLNYTLRTLRELTAALQQRYLPPAAEVMVSTDAYIRLHHLLSGSFPGDGQGINLSNSYGRLLLYGVEVQPYHANDGSVVLKPKA